MCTICGRPQTPKEVRHTIQSRFFGSAPRGETRLSSMEASWSSAAPTPPILPKRKNIIRMMPTIMITPCTTSVSAEPRYPPRNTAISVKAARITMHNSNGRPNVASNRYPSPW